MLRLSLRIAIGALLSWQAAIALREGGTRLSLAAGADWSLRLLADTDTRLRRALGPDAEALFALRAAVPEGTVLLNRKIMGRPEDYTVDELMRLAAKNGLVDQLTTLLYPDPWLFSVPEPIDEVEKQVRAGREMLLFTTPGDPTPNDRPGWTRETTNPRFETWRFRTG